jgi:hypothetical protein
VRVVDVPISFQQIFFIVEIERFRNATPGIKAINLSGDTSDFVELRLRYRHFIDRTTADRTALVEISTIVLFISCVEEQLVGDDGTAKLDTPSGFVIVL